MSDSNSDSSDEDGDESSLLGCEDPRIPTPEEIIERLVRSFFSEDYGNPSYWDTRYTASAGEYEWFQSWDLLLPHISEFVPSGGSALHLGCGNSPMSSDLLRSGFTAVLNIDISEVVIAQMRERYATDARLQWAAMDCSSLRCDTNSFDFAVDKGMLDALYCAPDSAATVARTLSEISRVLRPGAHFVDISFGRPDQRAVLVASQTPGLAFVKSVAIPNAAARSGEYYCYIFSKV
jgi:SAM-dependent methyltransferase